LSVSEKNSKFPEIRCSLTLLKRAGKPRGNTTEEGRGSKIGARGKAGESRQQKRRSVSDRC